VSSPSRRVLVTGGAGFIGANLCRRLLDSDDIAEVRVIDDLSSGSPENLAGLDLQTHIGSVLDPDVLEEAVNGCSHVVHLAAVPSVPRSIADPLRSHEVNATGTLRVLEAARRNRGAHVVLASSSSVYGANPALPKTEELMCMPVSPYAVSKLASEQYAMAYASCYQLPVLPFRFFNVFGPLQTAGHAYAAVIPAFVDAALGGRRIPVAGDGLQTRDFTFVDSVTNLIHFALVHDVTSGPVNLAFGTRTSLLEVIELLQRLLGRQLDVEFMEPRPGDVRHSQASNQRLRALFPDAKATPLEDGLTRTIDWFERLVPWRPSLRGGPEISLSSAIK
jgi:UDP-glucose 4-epimerase